MSAKALEKAIAHALAGEWDAAHAIVQRDESPTACWIHAVLHRIEGDPANARYWYARCPEPFSDEAPAAELARIRARLAAS